MPTTVASTEAIADPSTVPISTHRPAPLLYRSQVWPAGATAGVSTAFRSHLILHDQTSFSTLGDPRVPPGPRAAAGAVRRAPGLAAVLGGEREREQRIGRVVGGRLDRGPADHVVLVGGGLGVERPVIARAAGPHPARRQGRAPGRRDRLRPEQPGEVARAARAVDGRADLEIAPAVERGGQV